MRRFMSQWLGTAVAVLLCLGAAHAGQQNGGAGRAQSSMSSTPPAELVRRVVENELNARDEGHYLYRDWRKTPEGSKTKEMIETNDGVVARLIAVNDQPLTPQQKDAENARLKNLLSHPEQQAQKKKEQEQDEERVKKMFRELPKAFLYEYAGVEPGKSGEVIHLKFKPNPKYDPPSREMSVYRAMEGEMWVDASSERLVKIAAKLFRDITFGWGILGHLDQGGHFVVEQTKIGPERWEATDMDIQFTGKALLFKTINMRQLEKLTDFRKVPDGLTLAQGVDMLNHDTSGRQVAETFSGN